MIRSMQRAVVAPMMMVLILIPWPAGSQTTIGAASPEGKVFEVFLFTSSPTPVKDCWTFAVGGGFSARRLGSGIWQVIPFGSQVGLWWANASLDDVAVSELVGLSFPASGTALSGMVRVTAVQTGDEFQFGAWGFANPSCVAD